MNKCHHTPEINNNNNKLNAKQIKQDGNPLILLYSIVKVVSFLSIAHMLPEGTIMIC